MRLLRALAHLLLALALTTASVAQARVVSVVPGATQERPDHHHAATGEAAQAAHHHGGPASRSPVHTRDGCQTACCFAAAQLPARAPEAGAAVRFRAVRYVDAAHPVSGRADAPDPGIPKPAA
ncbi:hypothetical protein [Methylobacterium durans]|uniref:DUF2946 domain-containing protein n=1 Tax=Methylobacterium durans TaxID=2202825 RepID=A0A2U8W5W8_9HYPH|nr:hypothetical protein [Methylobacterium durans]AWN41493.1 hypothetical protein DK389_14445 [Methylobacterium durans]